MSKHYYLVRFEVEDSPTAYGYHSRESLYEAESLEEATERAKKNARESGFDFNTGTGSSKMWFEGIREITEEEADAWKKAHPPGILTVREAIEIYGRERIYGKLWAGDERRERDPEWRTRSHILTDEEMEKVMDCTIIVAGETVCFIEPNLPQDVAAKILGNPKTIIIKEDN